MSRLPSALQPAWPLFKRIHKFASFSLGLLFRRTSRLAGRRAPPRRATLTAHQTVALEPATVTLHPGGAGEQIRRPPPRGYPPDHWVFDSSLESDVPDRFTLEIAGGMVVGHYAAHVTPGKTLDYETSGYLGIESWRQHPIFLRPLLPPIEHVDGTLLSLATRGSAANYYHFLLDVLPRWGIFQECLPERVPDAVYLPARERFQKQLLAMLGLDRLPIIELGNRALEADRLLVPSTPNQNLVAPRWVVDWLRSQLARSGRTDLPRRLYVTRGNKPNTRQLLNEPEVWPLLQKRGFVRLDPGTLSVQEQIDCFAAAQAIVGVHGGGFSNLVFATPGVRVLELFAPSYVNACYWAISQNIPDASYRYFVGDDPTSHRVGKPMTGTLTDFAVDAKKLIEVLDEMLRD